MDSQMIDLSVVCHKYVFALRIYELFYLIVCSKYSFSLLGSELLLVSRNEGDMNVAIFIILKS